MNATTVRNRAFYAMRPLVPRAVQVWLRRRMAVRQRNAHAASWPVLESAGAAPPGWPGWPGSKQFAFVLMHDVERGAGQLNCPRLLHAEQQRGFRSGFNFVPERYVTSAGLRQMLRQEGFEIGVHGLYHDGKLFQSLKTFQERAGRINGYLAAWDAVGFCSPSSHHHLPWNHLLHIEYDSSTFDTDPFEPQPDGVNTIFPFLVVDDSSRSAYVELPYTMPQDFTLYILLGETNAGIWETKLNWIAQKGGMAMLTTHPDYMCFDGARPGREQYPARLYFEFLDFVAEAYSGQYWHALPREVAAYCREVLPAMGRPSQERDRPANPYPGST